MSSKKHRQEAQREKTLAELHDLLEQTPTPFLLSYLPVMREYARSPHRPRATRPARRQGRAEHPRSPSGRRAAGRKRR
jgi:hypothetical protein